MPIHDRNLKAGMHLTGKYHRQPYKCEVVEVEGKLYFRLEDGREFKSPCAAGMAITGHACDGWVFWNVESASEVPAPEVQETETQPEPTGETVSTQVAEVGSATEPSPQPAEPNNSNFFKMDWQKGVPKGQTRWHCNLCNKHFLVPTGETPQTCPEGHQAT